MAKALSTITGQSTGLVLASYFQTGSNFQLNIRYIKVVLMRLIIVIFSLTLVSCSGISRLSSDNSYLINEIIIRNETHGAIEDTQLTVEKFHRVFGCSYILPKTDCSTAFPQRPYEGNLITITWGQNGQTIRSTPMRIAIDKGCLGIRLSS